MYEFFDLLSELITAAIILLPILLYYLHQRKILNTKKEILLKEIEKGSIVDPEKLAYSLTNPVTDEKRLRNSLNGGIILCIAGFSVAVGTVILYSYLRALEVAGTHESFFNLYEMVKITLLATLLLVGAAIVLGVGIVCIVSYVNQKKMIDKRV